MSDYEPKHSTNSGSEGYSGLSSLVEAFPGLSDKLYDQLKFIALVALPAFGALYFGLAGIWGLPAAEQVVGTVTVVDTFLGVVLGISSKQYTNSTQGVQIGELEVSDTEEGGKTYSLNFPEDPSNIDQYDRVTFVVKKN